MPDFNVHIYAFDDAPMLRGAVESVPDGIPIHVFDGRHADFDGERNLTPEIKRFCRRHPDCHYYAPPADDLPFGHDHDLSKRGAGYAKSRFVFEHLPPDEWTLKMDTDERLETFDIDIETLAPQIRYCPPVEREADENAHISRLFQPRYWTPWIGDCFLPREVFPLDTSLDRLHTIWTTHDYRVVRFIRRAETSDIRIRNIGHERPASYQERRVDQLETRGRERRASEVAETL